MESAHNQITSFKPFNLLREAIDESILPATVGMYTAGPAGASSSVVLALGCFFCKKTTEYFFPNLIGSNAIDVGIAIANVGFTSYNSANLIRSGHCVVKEGVLKSGQFSLDVVKSAANYSVGFLAREFITLGADTLSCSESTKVALRAAVGCIFVSGSARRHDDILYRVYCQ